MVTVTEGELRPEPAQEHWFLLMDPAWQPVTENEEPPVEAVVGMWPLAEDGSVGKFRANPVYLPSDETSPTDPLDAVLRLAMAEQAPAEHLQLLLRDTLLVLGVHPDGEPVITRSPDDVPCVVVATSEPHRQRLAAPEWRQVDLGDLVELLADDVDVLFNPGGPATVRLNGDFLRETLMMDDEEVAELQATAEQDPSDLRIFHWNPDADASAGQPEPEAGDETPAAGESAAE